MNIRPDIPIILSSGSRAPAIKGKAGAGGIREFIARPISVCEITKVVEEVSEGTPSEDIDMTKILIVDDEAAIRSILGQLSGGRGTLMSPFTVRAEIGLTILRHNLILS